MMYSPESPTPSPSTELGLLLPVIQVTARESSQLVHLIILKGDAGRPPLPPAAPSVLSEFPAVKARLDDIREASLPLSGCAFLLDSAPPRLQFRIPNVVCDVLCSLRAINADLLAWLGNDTTAFDPTPGPTDQVMEIPPTPVSITSADSTSTDNECFKFDLADVAASGASAAAEAACMTAAATASPSAAAAAAAAAPPAHMSVVLEVILALLETSTTMLMASSNSRAGHGLDETKERASSSLDKARFQFHMYHPEDEGFSDAYSKEDRLGVGVLENHVSGLTSYLWFDLGSAAGH